jgi:hypothetical protein
LLINERNNIYAIFIMPRFAKGSKEAKEYMASIRKGKVSGGMMPSERTHFKPIKMSEYMRDAESPDSMDKTQLGEFHYRGRKDVSAPRMMPVTMPRQDLDTTDRVLDGVSEALRARLAQGTTMARASQGALKDAKRSAQLGAIDIRDYGMTIPAEGFSMYPNPPSRMPLSQEPAEMSGGGMECVDCKSCRGMGVIAIKKHLKR